jgi:hypothetical protein
MFSRQFWTERWITGALLVLSVLLLIPGVVLYINRDNTPILGTVAEANALFQLERYFVLTSVIVSTLGLVMLETLLRGAGDRIFARLGMVGFLFGAVLIVVVEALILNRQQIPYALGITYETLAFLSQAAYGASLLQTRLLPKWLGQASIVWNIGWLVVLTLANYHYIPLLHALMPLLIGILLLSRPYQASSAQRPGEG